MTSANGLGPPCSNADPAVAQATIYSLKPDARHHHEKPYAHRYKLDTEDVSQFNDMEMEKMERHLDNRHIIMHVVEPWESEGARLRRLLHVCAPQSLPRCQLTPGIE